jgi:hypothetical protein
VSASTEACPTRKPTANAIVAPASVPAFGASGVTPP